MSTQHAPVLPGMFSEPRVMAEPSMASGPSHALKRYPDGRTRPTLVLPNETMGDGYRRLNETRVRKALEKRGGK